MWKAYGKKSFTQKVYGETLQILWSMEKLIVVQLLTRCCPVLVESVWQILWPMEKLIGAIESDWSRVLVVYLSRFSNSVLVAL